MARPLTIGLGVLAGVGLLIAIADDEPDNTLCPPDTIPNPISGGCEQLML